MKTNKQKRYEAPKAEVIAIEHQSVLCASGGGAAAAGNPGAGINGMQTGTEHSW